MIGKNNRKRIVITGSKGCIGSILKNGLKGLDIYSLDLSEKNNGKNFKIDLAKNYTKLIEIFRGKDVIIHLAWNFFEDFPKETIDFRNKLMAENVYRAAVKAEVKRVIVASSVHANDYSKTKKLKLFDTGYPLPDSPYGASKVYIESLGKYYSKYHGLEIICVRFGGVNIYDAPIFEEDPNYDKVLLYRKDCVSLLRSCIESEKIPNDFQILTAVSKNKSRVHAISNFLNWQPNFPKR